MKILKPIFFIVFQFILCAFMLEVTSYFFLIKSSNPLYRSRRLLQYDADLGWMQKEKLNTKFENQILKTDNRGFRSTDGLANNSTEVKMLTLGPSSAFGWGVKNEQTYTSLSAKAINTRSINASGIGHSIMQGQLMWNKIKNDVHPDFVLISYGVNDLDKFRFFDADSINDKTFFQAEPRALRLDKLKLPSDFLVVLSLVIRQLTHTLQCDQLINFPQRVEWQDYKEVLTNMINEMRSRRIRPVLINTPFYLASPDPKFNEQLIIKAYAEVSALASKQQCSEAHEKLKYAKSLEPFSISHKIILLNKKLKDFANFENITLVDTYSILSGANAKENFYDPVHPSAKGHKLIADEIVKLIQQKN